MSWYNDLEKAYQRACLGSINEDDDTRSEMLYVINDWSLYKPKITEDVVYDDLFEIINTAPIAVQNFLKEIGVSYEKVEGLLDGAKVTGINVVFQSPLIESKAKTLHWGINIPRYLSEQAFRYAAYKYINKKYNLGITPFEGFILFHNYTSHCLRDSVNFCVRLNFPTDQTMFNGWKTPSNLSTIITRIFDVTQKDFTEYVLDGYSYWIDISNNIVEKHLEHIEGYQDDATEFSNSLPAVDFIDGDNSDDIPLERDIFLKSIKKAALILRKYMKEVDDVLVRS